MASRILFVCLGNICRSPAAEGVFRSLAPMIATDSAGTAGWHVGKPPYEPMQRAATARGYDLSDMRARQFVGADFDQFDLIIAMDDANIRDIEQLRPEGSAIPVRLFTDYASETDMTHVPDPYYTRDFDGALDLIEVAAKGLVATL
ncbi:low molecular weight protein-tyrosine-phosphatase [uncultured Roseovarius sp.]|uniref:low molecular weight protein-tyrosine-phosphatase n=1 Tax=uncultured Roseovarius sp. TaxID=293344 RepID=UPI002602FF45|nr:low molecular weight protein-tyrosine-phosphatase [uncultured Roseovarius sp.]